jgi:hypothetical protein
MKLAITVRWSALAALGIVAACSIQGSELEDDGSSESTGSGTGAAGVGGFNASGPSSGNGQNCAAGPDEDFDGDGFSVNDGDCNDCDPNTGPGAVEVIGAMGEPTADENCDGQVDEAPPVCDNGLALGDLDPMSGARAMDLCHTVANDGFGVVSANYVRANGSPASPALHVGILDGFGPNVQPRRGTGMLGLSSGNARIVGQAGECGSVSCGTLGAGTAPPNFPQDVPSCAGDTDINDDVALEVALKAPTNATGLSFEFSFYSHEFPEWVCTSFNDQFIALVTPPPAGSIDGNISFDGATNPVSVNIALFDVCEGCALGTGELVGTGFDTWGFGGLADAGATSWLQTTAPIAPGEEFTTRFAIWDTGDTAYDSTVLIDNFQWIADGGSVSVGTAPVPK